MRFPSLLEVASADMEQLQAWLRNLPLAIQPQENEIILAIVRRIQGGAKP